MDLPDVTSNGRFAIYQNHLSCYGENKQRDCHSSATSSRDGPSNSAHLTTSQRVLDILDLEHRGPPATRSGGHLNKRIPRPRNVAELATKKIIARHEGAQRRNEARYKRYALRCAEAECAAKTDAERACRQRRQSSSSNTESCRSEQRRLRTSNTSASSTAPVHVAVLNSESNQQLELQAKETTDEDKQRLEEYLQTVGKQFMQLLEKCNQRRLKCAETEKWRKFILPFVSRFNRYCFRMHYK
ncbi:Hypothetical predicted protein [Cloeon dipterum]|uniref:Uncharacterized protein n=1 Tax=Cloeon dipterum TaxID=197152 RepID=A0A8S1E464_9INSE|nr:Hypothetical predicted protein [Cloeon dipterum]